MQFYLSPKLWIKLLVKRLAHFMGYKLSKYGEQPPIDVRALGNHPALLMYHSVFQPILADLPISKGRGLRILPLHIAATHPFVLASQAGLEDIGGANKIYNILQRYYSQVQPETAAEWLGLTQSQDSTLHKEAPWAVSMPWDTRTPSEWREARERFAQEESKIAGIDLSIKHGWHFWGPVDENKLKVEAQRIYNLITSLKEFGHRRHNGHDGDIRAVMLRSSNGEWCWQVAGGEHRAAALSALGLKTIPVRVLQVVNREDVDIWPGVIAEIFSRKAALAIFDRILEGAIPDLVHRWSEAELTGKHLCESNKLPQRPCKQTANVYL